ncbi:MAG: hemin receptor [Prevotella sp.]|nr:hemin receptor [Prevotella sp.]
MKKTYLFAVMALSAMQMQAQNATQDTYVGAALATEDLNGTARYVGMGGAMDALGAEISTMGSNPAGIGLFRKGQVSATLGVNIQEEGKTFQDGSKTHVSFDQAGVVFCSRTGKSSYLNFGFNYHKNRNFNHVLFAANALNGSSQSSQTVLKDMNGLFLNRGLACSQLDDLYLGNMVLDENEILHDYAGNAYDFTRANTGYIGEFDFNISGNIKNRLYLGLTVGVHSVRYKNYSEYYETLSSQEITDVLISDNHKITGHGINVKAGLIFRPVEESPFRIGVSVATPTFYRLTTENYTTIGTNVDRESAKEDFRFNTPWKFGLSLGHTVGDYLALGAVYEYADYGACDMRTIDGGRYNYDYYYDDYTYYENSSSDNVMKRHTENTLKGVSTLKLGAEFKADKSLAIRIGYNYVSPMYQENGVRDQTLQSPGVYYASTTHYINWKDTHRITAGVGFSFDKFRLDLAYQYSMRKGDFYPFMKDYSAAFIDEDTNQTMTLNNHCDAVSVKDNRHQIQCSLTYSF